MLSGKHGCLQRSSLGALAGPTASRFIWPPSGKLSRGVSPISLINSPIGFIGARHGESVSYLALLGSYRSPHELEGADRING